LGFQRVLNILKYLDPLLIPIIIADIGTNLKNEHTSVFSWVTHKEKKDWLLYDLDHQKLIVTRDVQFYEHFFPYANRKNPLSYLPVQSKSLQAQDLC